MRRAVTIAAFVLLSGIPVAASAQGYGIRSTSLPKPVPRDSLPRDRVARDVDPVEDARGTWDNRLQHCLNDRDQSKRQRRQCRDQGMPVRRNKSH